MPDAIDGFKPIMTDSGLAELDSRIQTMDPSAAEVLRQQVLQAAKDASSAKQFVDIALKVLGGAVGLFLV